MYVFIHDVDVGHVDVNRTILFCIAFLILSFILESCGLYFPSEGCTGHCYSLPDVSSTTVVLGNIGAKVCEPVHFFCFTISDPQTGFAIAVHLHIYISHILAFSFIPTFAELSSSFVVICKATVFKHRGEVQANSCFFSFLLSVASHSLL